MLAATAGLGLLIGIVIGGLGGGGGVLTVPVLVYVLGQTPQDAITSSVVIVGSTAVIGTMARLRGGLLDWRTGLAFGALGLPSAYLGTHLNRHVAEHVLLLAFAAVTIIAAAAMLLDSRDRRRSGPEPDDQDPPPLPDPPSGTTTVRVARQGTRTARQLMITAGNLAGCGLAVGFLTGFLGVGGGFLAVPALVIVLRMPMASAIGTSLMIIALNSATSFVSRLGVTELDWTLIVPFTLAAIAGTFLGKRIADRLSGPTLTRAFAIMLVLVGAFVAVESLVAR